MSFSTQQNDQNITIVALSMCIAQLWSWHSLLKKHHFVTDLCLLRRGDSDVICCDSDVTLFDADGFVGGADTWRRNFELDFRLVLVLFGDQRLRGGGVAIG